LVSGVISFAVLRIANPASWVVDKLVGTS
jgi:hypothetical protein